MLMYWLHGFAREGDTEPTLDFVLIADSVADAVTLANELPLAKTVTRIIEGERQAANTPRCRMWPARRVQDVVGLVYFKLRQCRPDEVIVSCSVPVLGIPIANVPKEIGRNILTAWDASRGAGRAMNDALPPFARAESVTTSFGRSGRATVELHPSCCRPSSSPRRQVECAENFERRHGDR